MTIQEAVQQVNDGIRPGLRGVGCAAIYMMDGRKYYVARGIEDDVTMLERYTSDGDLAERKPVAEIRGEVECVSWSCDESGAVYI